MSEEAAAAGRLYLEVVADASGLRTSITRAVGNATKGIKAKIGLALDTAQFRTEVATAAKGVQAEVRVVFDRAQIRRELATKLAQAANRVAARVGIDVDDTQARAVLARLAREQKATVRTGADTSGAESDIEQMRRRAQSNPVSVDVRVNRSMLSVLGTVLTKLSMFPMMVSGILAVGGALGNLAGVGYAAVASLSQVVGLLAVLPNLAGAALTGVAALMIGFSGIGEAVKQLGAAQSAGAQGAKQAAATHTRSASAIAAAQERVRSAMERVRDAQERLMLSRERLSEVEYDAAQRVGDVVRAAAEKHAAAYHKLQEAHERVRASVVRLSQARLQAAQRLADLRLESAGSALDEEGAALAIRRAEARLRQINQIGANASDLDKAEADLAYRQSLQRLEEVRARNARLAGEREKFDKDGIEGSHEVAAAHQDIIEAQHAEKVAARELVIVRAEGAEALRRAEMAAYRDIRDANRALFTSKRDLAEAQRDLVVAQRGVGAAMRTGKAGAVAQTAAMAALGKALNDLSPAGQRFARFVNDTLIPRWKQLRRTVQEALLPQIQEAISKAMPLLDVLEKGLAGTARRIGALAVGLGEKLGSESFGKDVGKIMQSNNRATTDFGKALIGVVDALRHIAVVAGPTLLEPFAKWVRALGEGSAKSAKAGRQTGKMADFFERAKKTAKTFARILSGLWGALLNVGKAARPSGDTLLERWADGAERIRKWTADPKNQKRMREFFDNALKVGQKVGELFSNIAKFFGRLSEATGGDTLDGLFTVLNGFVKVLEFLVGLPGGGEAISTLLLLSGAGVGLGLVAKTLGGIATGLKKLGKYSGAAKLVEAMTGGLGAKNTAALTAKQAGAKVGRGAKAVGGAAGKAGGAVKSAAGSVATGLAESAAGSALAALGGKVKDKVGAGAKAVKGAAGKAGGAVKSAAGSLASGLAESAGSALGALGGKAKDAAGKAKGAAGKAAGGVRSAVSSGATKVKAFAASRVAAVRGKGDKGSAGVGMLGSPLIAAGIDKASSAASKAARAVGTYTASLAKAGSGALAAGLSKAAGALGGLKAAAGRAVDALGSLRLANLKTAAASAAGATKAGLMAAKQKLAAVATKAWTVAQKLLNLAMTNNPLGWVIRILTLLGAALVIAYKKSATFRKIVDGAWKAIQSAVRVAWNDYIKPALSALRDFLVTQVAPKITWFYNKIIKPTWDLIVGAIKVAIGLITGNFDLVKKGLSKMGEGFSALGQVAKAAWDKLIEITKKPIKWVLETVLNNGILAGWNKVAGFFNIQPQNLAVPIPKGLATGGVLPGYTPGRDVHRFVSPTGGALDLSGGEAVMRPEFTRVVGERFIHGVNAAARTGGVRAVASTLGIAGDRGGVPGFADGGIIGGIQSFFGKAKDFFVGGIRAGAKVLTEPVLTAIETALSASSFTKGLAGIPRRAVGGFLDWLDTKDDQIGGVGRKAVTAARTQIGVPYVWGGTAWDQGLDCSGLVQQAWLRAVGKTMPRTTYTMLPWLRKITGSPQPGDLGFPHTGHVWMYSDKNSIIEAPFTGANVRETPPRPAFFVGRPPESFLRRDRGGPLPRGYSGVLNATGGTEWVITPEAVRMLGGPRAVQALNDTARTWQGARSSVATTSARPAPTGYDGPPITQNVYPQPRQSEHEIAMISARKIGDLIGL